MCLDFGNPQILNILKRRRAHKREQDNKDIGLWIIPRTKLLVIFRTRRVR